MSTTIFFLQTYSKVCSKNTGPAFVRQNTTSCEGVLVTSVSMKKLRCTECKSYDLMPPSAERTHWLCNSCLSDFKVGRKDAKRILERADKKSIDLGEYR